MKKIISIILTVAIMPALASVTLLTSDKASTGLSHAISYLKSEGVREVIVPSAIPQNKTTYFVNSELKPNTLDYSVSFDYTEKCKGAQYCSAGSIDTEFQGNPTIYFDNKNQEITERIVLANQHTVYYTPSHAMGSFWPARAEWRCGTTLYTLSWTLPAAEERTTLLQMVSDMWSKACASSA
jgi:hypothetical protein